MEFTRDIKPILDQRCVACHSCFSAPCQLKLSSYDGLLRGLSPNEIYSGSRLESIHPSRLQIDAHGNRWRDEPYDFRPVIPYEKEPAIVKPFDFLTAVTIHRKIRPLPVNQRTEQTEDARVCPLNPDDLADHLEEKPNAGMPYGLPPISDAMIEKIQNWVLQGAPGPEPVERIDPEDRTVLLNGEKYFEQNGKSAYGRLVNRYIYEHLYLGHFYTGPVSGKHRHFYRLIRSERRCGNFNPGDEIATRRPWGLPQSIGEKEFHYCFVPITETITHKDHIVYRFDERRIQRWKELFPLSEDRLHEGGFLKWVRNGLVHMMEKLGEDGEHLSRTDRFASNPFDVFRRIPIKSRYNFLLDDLKFYITTFIRGPVCHGSIAVNAIDDHFWVYMIRPESDLMVQDERFAEQAVDLLFLPARTGSDSMVSGIAEMIENRKARNRYRVLRNQVFQKKFPSGYQVSDIWNGKQGSPNHDAQLRDPVLTVFRHYNSANVEYGNLGPPPKTTFVMDYSLVERLYYALVSGFDVFGDVEHQLGTRFYMGYLRMESEELFLSFLPSESREPLRNSWYVPGGGISERITDVLFSSDYLQKYYPQLGLENPTGIVFHSTDPYQNKIEMYNLLNRYLEGAGAQVQDPLNPAMPEKTIRIQPVRSVQDFEREFARLTVRPNKEAGYVNFFPDHSHILLRDGKKHYLYTLIRNKTHANVLWMDSESERRTPGDDHLVLYRGLTGSYPNLFFDVDLDRATGFVQQIQRISSPVEFDRLRTIFGRQSNDFRFWDTYDSIMEVASEIMPVQYGVIDLSRYGIPANVDTPGWKGNRGTREGDMKWEFMHFYDH